MRKVVIAGGGAAGMAAAISAAERGFEVHIFEKNEKLGKKVFITGKGRCNVTNACDMETMLRRVVTNPRFLYSSFYGFTNEDMMRLLEENGCPLKTERGERVFPVSDKSSDVIAALTRKLKALGVQVHLRAEVKELLAKDGRCAGIRTGRAGVLRTDRSSVFGGCGYRAGGTGQHRQGACPDQHLRHRRYGNHPRAVG